MMGEGQNMGTRFYEHVLDDYANVRNDICV